MGGGGGSGGGTGLEKMGKKMEKGGKHWSKDPLSAGENLFDSNLGPGSMFGQITGQDDAQAAHDARQKADADRREAMGFFDKLADPTFDTTVNTQQGTEFDKVKTDPALRDAQMRALGSLEKIGQGGLLDSDRAALAGIQRDVAQQDRSRREAILQSNAARGMAGSGNELLARMQSSQGATDRANMSGLNIAGMAQQRALDALDRAGTLGGNIRGQDFGEQSARAEAQDRINQFNTVTKNQGVQDANQWKQTTYGNQADRAGSKANIAIGQAAVQDRRADQRQATSANKQGAAMNMAYDGVKKFTSMFGGG